MDVAFAAPTTAAPLDRPDTTAPAPPSEVSKVTPAPTDGRAFRRVLGKFATGVTVVTCATPVGPVGMTVNSFTSLSLEPPLVMWSPAKSSRRYPAFAAAPRFAIHVLHARQQPLADAFMRAADAFGETDWLLGEDGLPLIEGCLARFACERAGEHDAGDHMIMVGKVTAMEACEGDPLLYFGGKYSQLVS